MGKSWNLGEAISFPPYRLEPASGRLRRGEMDVPLRSKTFAVLEYLARHPGRLVSKDELLDAVWPETHVTPSVVTGCIRELRRALDDDARAARIIETAHRRGYRFIASVGAGPPARATAPASAEDPGLRLLDAADALPEEIDFERVLRALRRAGWQVLVVIQRTKRSLGRCST
jgi:DNA-binding winged helix-turn-helix (wHTH) protein